MIQRFVVSTACPTCGAPLDFSEGSNAIACQHCRARLLVTGRRQILTYAIHPKIDARDAASRALFAHREVGERARIRAATLCYLPYYRFTGHDLRWERTGMVEEEERERPLWSRWLSGDTDAAAPLADIERPRHELRDRHVEKNFIAVDFPGGNATLYSLGLRPTLLRVRLFQQSALGEGCKVVAPTMAAPAALEQALKGPRQQPILHRSVIGRSLSLLYYPYWVLEIAQRYETVMTFVDAVTSAITLLDASPTISAALDRAPAAGLPVAGFRPLACPNCGWEVTLAPEDIVAWCSSCRRAWQIDGRELREIAYAIVAVPNGNGNGDGVQYLPFWVLTTSATDATAARYFVPAFRYRRPKFVVDMARALCKRPPPYTLTNEGTPGAHGCFYDQDDAVELMRLVLAGQALERGQDPPASAPNVDSATLTWFSYHSKGGSLIDPFTGRAFYESMIG